ncbi:MAG: glucose-6-phosphate isomerase [Nitrospinae bacterium]|nr:glucose-6-phosphate isomerase [Nitrospinota bacterium]
MTDIVLDYTNVMATAVGPENGLAEEQLTSLKRRAAEIHNELSKKRNSGALPFYDLPYQKESAQAIITAAKKIKRDFSNMVVLGIGGSALGTTALFSALRHSMHNSLPYKKRGGTRLYILDNIDPDWFEEMIGGLKLKETVFNVISKSGATAETMAQFMIILDTLKKKLGKKEWRKHLIITTDKKSGSLRPIAEEHKLKSFEVPDGVGGRFTALTPVSLLPAACAGVDIEALLEGAARMDERLKNGDIMGNPAYLFASIHYLLDTVKAKKMAVMMPYSNKLYYMADWFRQLWAESLGKKKDIDGAPVHTGQTPIKALGATDQHSQVQLYVEGPFDKVVTFLEVGKFENVAPIPDEFPGVEDVSYLSGHSLNELIGVEKQGTEYALTKNNRPNLTIRMPQVDAHSVGQLIYMLEVATAFAGGLYRINAFDQPGVEFGKNYAYAKFGKKGYEDLAREIAETHGQEKRTV